MWRQTELYHKSVPLFLGFQRFAIWSRRPCRRAVDLVGTSRGFGAHHLYFWCAPKVAAVRTKTSGDAEPRSFPFAYAPATDFTDSQGLRVRGFQRKGLRQHPLRQKQPTPKILSILLILFEKAAQRRVGRHPPEPPERSVLMAVPAGKHPLTFEGQFWYAIRCLLRVRRFGTVRRGHKEENYGNGKDKNRANKPPMSRNTSAVASALLRHSQRSRSGTVPDD